MVVRGIENSRRCCDAFQSSFNFQKHTWQRSRGNSVHASTVSASEFFELAELVKVGVSSRPRLLYWTLKLQNIKVILAWYAFIFVGQIIGGILCNLFLFLIFGFDEWIDCLLYISDVRSSCCRNSTVDQKVNVQKCINVFAVEKKIIVWKMAQAHKAKLFIKKL